MLAAVAGLTDLSGEDVGPWTRVRPRLAAGLGEPEVLFHVDALVQTADLATAQWRVAVGVGARGQPRRRRRARRPRGRRPRARLAVERARRARSPSCWPRCVARPVTPADVDLLAADVARRDTLVAALALVAAPGLVAPEHQALVSASAADAAAVRALAAGLAADGAAPTDRTRAALGSLATAREAAVAGRSAAVRAWEEAVARAASLLGARPLPEPPLV